VGAVTTTEEVTKVMCPGVVAGCVACGADVEIEGGAVDEAEAELCEEEGCDVLPDELPPVDGGVVVEGGDVGGVVVGGEVVGGGDVLGGVGVVVVVVVVELVVGGSMSC